MSAFVSNEPEIVCVPENTLEPVVANVVEFIPSNKSAFNAYDAVIALDAVTVLDDDIANEEVVVNDDDTALFAQLEVPNNEPVIPLVTFNEPLILPPLPLINSDPVITAEPLNGNPEPAPAFNA